MKTKLTLLLACLLITAVAAAQNNPPQTSSDVANLNLEYGSAAIAPVKMNVLYVGVINPLQIAANGIDNFDVKVSQGTIIWQGKNIIHLRVDNPGECIVSLVDKSGKEFFRQSFRVKRVPDPNALVKFSDISARTNSMGEKLKISKENLINAKTLEVVMKNFDYEIEWRVTRFKMTAIRKNKDIVELESESNMITTEMKSIFETVNKGDKIYFEYIRAMGEDGTIRSLQPINFEIE